MPDDEPRTGTLDWARWHLDEAHAKLRAGHWGRAYHHAHRCLRALDDLGIRGELRRHAEGLAQEALSRDPGLQGRLPLAA